MAATSGPFRLIQPCLVERLMVVPPVVEALSKPLPRPLAERPPGWLGPKQSLHQSWLI